MRHANPRSRQAIAATALLATIVASTGCGSGSQWYSSYGNDTWDTTSYSNSHHRRSGGSYQSHGIHGGSEELLVVAAVYVGYLAVVGTIELGEYCIDYCSTWFD